ncbi:hypothetical protein ACXWTF_01970 [Thiomicrolovo sp. ZZH C-3]
MLQMLDQLDQLDKMDFDDAISEAESCIIARNFRCARKQLAKAESYARSAQDKTVLEHSRRNLKAEIRQEEREEEERIALEEEMEELRKEQKRAEREYARRMAMEEDDSAGSSGMDFYNRMMESAMESRRMLEKADRDTYAAVRKTNEMMAMKQREDELAARQKRMDAARQAQQRDYERRQREQRAAEKQRRYDQQQKDLERKRQKLANAEEERSRQKQERRLASAGSASATGAGGTGTKQYTCYLVYSETMAASQPHLKKVAVIDYEHCVFSHQTGSVTCKPVDYPAYIYADNHFTHSCNNRSAFDSIGGVFDSVKNSHRQSAGKHNYSTNEKLTRY